MLHHRDEQVFFLSVLRDNDRRVLLANGASVFGNVRVRPKSVETELHSSKKVELNRSSLEEIIDKRKHFPP